MHVLHVVVAVARITCAMINRCGDDRAHTQRARGLKLICAELILRGSRIHMMINHGRRPSQQGVNNFVTLALLPLSPPPPPNSALQ